MTDFNARRWAADALDSSLDADPHVVASELADKLPSHLVREALRQILPDFCSSMAASLRAQRMRTTKPDAADNSSPRWDSVKDQAPSILMTRMYLPGGHKFLRDCTHEDLLAAIEDRRSRAAALVSASDRLTRLADLLAKRSAKKVGDLSEDEVKGALS